MNTPTNMKKLLVLTAGSLLLGGCASIGNDNANAIDANNTPVYEDRIGRHFYAATGLGASRLEPDVSEIDGVDVNDRVEGAGQITLGMDVSRQVAVELHSADLGSAGLSGGTGRINYHVHGASMLLYAGKQRHNYRRHGLTGYGRVGVGLLDNSAVGSIDYIQDNSAHLLVGAGIEYMTKIGLGLRAEAISFDEDINYGQLALVYRTGARRSKRPVQIVKTPEPVQEPTPAAVVVPAIKVVEAPTPAPAVYACEEFSGTLEGINFHSDSAELTDSSLAVLSQAADKLKLCEDTQLTIAAHTDSQGKKSYNQALSERRAQSVLENLEAQGIEVSRMRTEAYGETRPIDDNSTAEGRSRNRRVEVIAQ